MKEAAEAGESHTGLASARCPGGNKGGGLHPPAVSGSPGYPRLSLRV